MGRPKKNETRVNELKESQLYQEIKRSLESQLKYNQNNQKYYIDLIEDYMELWIEKELLKEDILKRGVVIQWKNGDKQSGYKKNDSLIERRKTQSEMSKILTTLNLTYRDVPANPTGSEENDNIEL